MKRKLIAGALLVAMILVLFTGCQSGGVTPAGSSGADSNSASTSNTAEKTFNLTMQCHNSGEQLVRTMNPTLELIEKETGGTVKITANDAGSLCAVPEMLQAVSSGVLDCALWPEGTFKDQIPVTSIGAGVPFAFNNVFESYMFMWHRGYLEMLREAYAEYNIYVIPFECLGAGLMTKNSFSTLDDLKGVKLRGSGNLSLWLDAIGAAVTPVAGSELYTALSQGVVEGATWGDASGMYEVKMMENCKYYMMPEPIIGNWNCLYFNLDVWNSFSEEQRHAIEASIKNGGESLTSQVRANYTRALTSMQEDYGVTVVNLSPEEKAKALEAAETVWDKIAAVDEKAAKAIQMVREFRAEPNNEAPYIDSLKW